MSPSGPLVVLCVNSGSSSLKTALFEVDDTTEHDLGRAAQPVDAGDHPAALDAAIAAFHELGLPVPAAVGHRVVHGGPHHAEPVLVDGGVLAELRELVPFAPLHMPAAISGIEAIAERWDIPQVACFDTAFHHDMPALAKRLPLPDAITNAGVRRYGFHGLSYEYVVGAVGATELGRGVIAHLGNGASMVGVRDGKSVDTTMGFTPTSGLLMSTRTGDLDPGVPIYLLRELGYDADRLERLVDRESGLVALGGTPDMQALVERREGDPRAAFAVDAFCYDARRHIGALAAVLGGLDTLVFTGGIGEKAVSIRAEICAGLEHLGITLDGAANEAHADVISASGAACTVRVVPTDEDLVIARHTAAVVGR